MLAGTFAAAALVATAPAFASTSEANCFLSAINTERASGGLPALASNAALVSIAQTWSQHLASAGTLSHNPNLASLAPASWMKLGENVGMGPTCDAIATAFWNSPEHKANIMDPAFSQVGVATVDASGTIFVTEDFMGTGSAPVVQAAPKATQPAPVVTHAPAPAPVVRTVAPAPVRPAVAPAPAVAAPASPAPVAAASPSPEPSQADLVALTVAQVVPLATPSQPHPAAAAPHVPHRNLVQRMVSDVGSFFSSLF